MSKLVLFDIDGTLIRCGKAPRKAIMDALTEVYGTPGNNDGYSFSGRTDSQIVFDLISPVILDEKKTLGLLPTALALYVKNLNNHLRSEDVRVLSGVIELLSELKGRSEVVTGLLTGNVIEGARIKLSRAGLEQFFFNGNGVLGAFGSDSRHREDLPPLAVERAFQSHGRRFAGKDIVIIGDSPHDITCGRALNVRSIAVATGWHTTKQLQEYVPDAAVEDMSDTNRMMNLILN